MARAYSLEARPLSNATLARMQAAFDVSQFCRQDVRFGTRSNPWFSREIRSQLLAPFL